ETFFPLPDTGRRREVQSGARGTSLPSRARSASKGRPCWRCGLVTRSGVSPSLLRRVGRRRDLVALHLQLLLDDGQGPVQLLIRAGVLLRRVVVHDDVRRDAATLDDPLLALDVVARELGAVEVTAVQQRQRTADADHAAPAPLAHQLAELVLAEAEREQ